MEGLDMSLCVEKSVDQNQRTDGSWARRSISERQNVTDVLKGCLFQRDELNQKSQEKIAAERRECFER